MTISIATVYVVVDDPDAAVTFYRDTLGFAVRNEVKQGDFRWITLSPDSQPEIQLVLTQPHAGRSQADGDAVAALLAKGELGAVNFRAEDLDAVFEKITAAPGVEILQEPASQPWGVRDAAFRDPAGNTVRIQQA
ncbi:VOC family protein [Tsukamurella sp. 8F]|uniref:VOC family protein n=1 Tax=unclassified Tsukamurella TaxID=2633480 RepID=UPI0023B96EFF|nr:MULTISPECIES: VOC family protein [unclassified Tsukamurella]MDF0532165.1 VOC family protein [Tsukamurella sp. 8J]MDF0589449.1 VOC family protein [Tsukamurella sp. 8F]